MNKKAGITWRSWWDDGSPEGPIQTKWQVEQRPVIYVLDAEGIIRFKSKTDVAVEDLDKAIEAALEQTRKSAKGNSP